ncbi:MAG: TM2 domain-containing protein [Rothia sp. (in: high G+C Gram-positive bacteria)]|nr:TM2 domain-containing protein [Rothia sp. (in: high G+C Gram-positive bacteria)]
MAQQPEHYTPQYINNHQRNPFAPSYGLGGPGYQSQPTYVIHQKSVLISYLLWFFLGVFGAHKFYLRQPMMGIFYLILHGLGWLTAPIFIGYGFFVLLGLLLFIDLFTMPIRVGLMNSLANRRIF